MSYKSNIATEPALIAKLMQKRKDALDTMYRIGQSLTPDFFDYGPIDPVLESEKLLNPCVSCGAKPEQVAQGSDARQVAFACLRCGHHSEPAFDVYAAVLNWNRDPKISRWPQWSALPFFLAGIEDKEQARKHLETCDALLSAQAEVLRIERQLRHIIHRKGRTYSKRILAYCQWAKYSLMVLDAS